MLPNSPRAGRSLTTSRRAPSTQSRSISQSRYDGLSDYGGGTEDRYHRPGAVHQVRPQRSMGNLTSRPSNVNNMPPIPRLSKPPLSASASPTYSRGPFPRKSSESSASSSSSYVSASSSVPSFLDRMKQRYPGSSSSQTSLEIESDEPTGKGRPQYSQYSERRRGTIVGRERRNLSQQITVDSNQQSSAADYMSYGYSIWDRVATAAKDLADNVNHTWAEKSAGRFGENDSREDEESELTRAMKAYHLSKARDRFDLPDWLFSEQERGGVRGYARTSDHSERQRWDRTQNQTPEPRKEGLRDVYDNARASSAPSSYYGGRGTSDLRSNNESPGAATTKSVDRLRALRDAKRQAATAGSSAFASVDERSSSRHYTRDIRAEEPSNYKIRAVREVHEMPPPRIGLPTGPRRR